MINTPMPSPRGTNRAGLYLPSGSRVEAAYDAALKDANGKPMVDSATGYKILTACQSSLDMDEMGRLIDALQACDPPLLTKVEVDAINSVLNDSDGNATMAGDSARRRYVPRAPSLSDLTMFPHANRLK